MHDDEEEDELRPFFVPRYGELSLYLMSLAALLLFALYEDVRSFLLTDWLDSWDPRRWIIVLGFLLGIGCSIRHVFTTGFKSFEEKACMLYFAVFANGFAGIAASWHFLFGPAASPSIFLLLPLWNLFSAVMLIALYRIEIVDENSIIDDDATPMEVVLGTIFLLFGFVLCRYAFDVYWAVTYSACVAYASTLSRHVGRLAARISRAWVGIGAKKPRHRRSAGARGGRPQSRAGVTCGPRRPNGAPPP